VASTGCIRQSLSLKHGNLSNLNVLGSKTFNDIEGHHYKCILVGLLLVFVGLQLGT
jgi:hypothetical protein